MKIKKLAIIILMITFFMILETKVYATTGIINSKTVNLKKEPDSKTILEYLNKGDEVEILDYQEGWYKVKAQTELGKITGYINEKEVDIDEDDKITEKEENKITENSKIEEKITSDIETETTRETEQVLNKIEEKAELLLNQEVSLKVLPIINSMEKSKATGNVTIIEIINDWVKIESDYTDGWIRKNELKNSIKTEDESVEKIENEQPENVQQEETTTKDQIQENQNTELNKIGYVSTDGLRVRKEASTDSEELDSLSKNDKVQIIGQEGKWYKIKLDGKDGYVSSKYISDTKVPETTSRSGSTLKNQEIEKKLEDDKIEEDSTTENSVDESKSITGEEIVQYAEQYIGYKYVAGGNTPLSGFDCSGFTQYIYKHFGIELNRTSKGQKENGVEIEKNDLQLGDIVFFNNDANTVIGHVGIYIGNGNFIHASNPNDGVKITTLSTGYYQKRYVGARRVI